LFAERLMDFSPRGDLPFAPTADSAQKLRQLFRKDEAHVGVPRLFLPLRDVYQFISSDKQRLFFCSIRALRI